MTSFTAAPTKCKDNWEQREEEGTSDEPSQEHQSVVQRILADAIERRQMGFEGLSAARPTLLKVFGRIERLNEQIDQAFGGQVFDVNLSPLCPANIRRFNAYVECRSQATRLLEKAIELWMLTCGFQRNRTPPTPQRRRSRRR